MPLSTANLLTDLNSLFSNPPDNGADCAAAWGDAMKRYAQGIIPASTAVTAASATLESSLTALFPYNKEAWFLGVMEVYFKTWATTIGNAMPGYTSVPPAGDIGFASIGDQTTHGGAALKWRADINTWMKTGVSTLIASPYTVVPWS